jgi:hypothetical protein
MARSQKHSSRKFILETLEGRTMLTGNVLGVMLGTTLDLTGDAQDNEIEVVQIAPNTIRVIGHSGTTVNGLPDDLFVFGLLENIQADLHDGDDKAAFESTVLPDSLNVTTGKGDDDIKLHRVQADQISINTCKGQDTVRGRIVNIADKLSVETESGEDKIRLNRLRTNELDISTGSENDKVDMTRIRAGGIIQIVTEDGHDVVSMNTVSAQGILLDNGLGNDRDTIQRVRAGRIQVLTGSNLDELRMNRVRANDIVIDSLDGNDHLSLSRVMAVNDLHLNSGDDDDVVKLNNVHSAWVSGNIDIHLGRGNDSLQVNHMRSHDVHFNASDGSDKIDATTVRASDELIIEMGNGEDALALENSWYGGSTTIDGGNGFDTLYDEINFFDEVAASVNFESII